MDEEGTDRDPVAEVFRRWEERDRAYYRGKERDIIIFYGGGALLLGIATVFWFLMASL